MKELNEKLILSIAAALLIIGLAFNFLYPSDDNIEAKAPNTIKEYKLIDIPEALAVDADWPKAKEQARGEMFDLFTPPEIFLDENGEFVFRPPYAATPKGPFGIELIAINMNPYRFQLEGFVEEDRNDQSKTIILVHSVEDGKSLRLSPNASDSTYGFKILDWRVERNFNENDNSEVIAWLKLEDSLSDRIINLSHYESLYEDSMEVVFKVDDSNESFVLSEPNTSFFVENIEYRLEMIDYENLTALVTKIIPDADPLTELLSINTTDTKTFYKSGSNPQDKQAKKALSVEEAFDSFF